MYKASRKPALIPVRPGTDSPRIEVATLCSLHAFRQNVGLSRSITSYSGAIRLLIQYRIDIVAKKNGGGRGQAFVVFAEQAAATSAMRTLTGELFYTRELVSGRPICEPSPSLAPREARDMTHIIYERYR
jgi:hypothetical protein